MSKFRTPKGETEAEAEAETWHAYLWDQFKGSYILVFKRGI
jgi:hypothetical protein